MIIDKLKKKIKYNLSEGSFKQTLRNEFNHLSPHFTTNLNFFVPLRKSFISVDGKETYENDELVLVRDGLFSLLPFVKELSQSASIQFILPLQMKPFLNQEQLSTQIFYQYRTIEKEKHFGSLKDTLFLFCDHHRYSIDTFDTDLFKANLSYLKEKYRFAKVNLLMTSNECFGDNFLFSTQSKFHSMIREIVNFPLEYHDFQGFKNHSSLQNMIFYNLDQFGCMSSDPYILHFVASRGARLHNSNGGLLSSIFEHKLSPYHSIHFFKFNYSERKSISLETNLDEKKRHCVMTQDLCDYFKSFHHNMI